MGDIVTNAQRANDIVETWIAGCGVKDAKARVVKALDDAEARGVPAQARPIATAPKDGTPNIMTVTPEEIARLTALCDEAERYFVNPHNLTTKLHVGMRSLLSSLTTAREEIERLTKINVGLVHDFNTLLVAGARQEDETKALRVERDALREALTKLVDENSKGFLSGKTLCWAKALLSPPDEKTTT